MSIRHIMIRNELYPEEIRLETGISQQVAIYVDHAYPNSDIYEVNYQRKILEHGTLIKKNAAQRSGLISVIFYVLDEKLALELAHRWVNEENQNKQDYRVIGINHSYSVFD
jgi:hypothetical protein